VHQLSLEKKHKNKTRCAEQARHHQEPHNIPHTHTQRSSRERERENLQLIFLHRKEREKTKKKRIQVSAQNSFLKISPHTDSMGKRERETGIFYKTLNLGRRLINHARLKKQISK
jgi:hypothetical protein